MSKRFAIILTAVLCLAVGGGVGFLIGAAYTGVQMKSYLLDTNASWLDQHFHYLALIRMGHAERAAADIEKTLDNCIVQLSWPGRDGQGKFHPEKLSHRHLSALRVGRVYADAGYRDAFSTESLRVLDQVTPPDGNYCSPALRELQGRAKETVSTTTGPARRD